MRTPDQYPALAAAEQVRRAAAWIALGMAGAMGVVIWSMFP